MKYANCSFCDGSVKPEQIETEFWWGDQLVVFENVPAGVCEVCGEQYFQGEVYDRMVKLAQVERSEIPIHRDGNRRGTPKSDCSRVGFRRIFRGCIISCIVVH
jgi:YgiT-type zinc finger domain-containing protein